MGSSKTLLDESINRGLVCAYMHSIKRTWHSCPKWVNAGNENTPSIHHPRRRNMTTSMVGLKTVTYAEVSPKMVNPREIAGERRRRIYHFHWPSLCPGVTRSAESKTCWLHFFPHFSSDQGWNLMLWWSNSSWTSWDYFWVRFSATWRIFAVLLTASKTWTLECIPIFANQFDSNLVWW